MIRKIAIIGLSAVSLAACAVPDKVAKPIEASATQAEQERAQKQAFSTPEVKRLKRKVAIARFSNETRYGKTFLRDNEDDPLGKQATDMLSSQLVESGKFLIFERPDIEKIKKEQEYIQNVNMVGVDTLIVGSVTEFGRKTVGKSGFLSSTKKQVARAKVEIRLIDSRTGHVFFSADGAGEATNEAGSVVGFGNRAEYDATLNDRAIAAAISSVMSEVVQKLDERTWRTDILRQEGSTVFISGGERQGLSVGDLLVVMKAGETVRSGQSGFDIQLPAEKIGSLKVVSFFGTDETNEGSVTQIVDGVLDRVGEAELFVAEEAN
ncbi:curli production assembly protein CsgG [Kiloniella laminariae]|uniref:Curli production assembly protein CsgG n=1 Tax=Kiloniella laminariae TaxID=454162 RepID=A0ABT4LFN3_9PROT|nr:CsgG/HfaB family protein [Kiloniella laminariae]MCZ4279151.1 curli production assembly protein CsgG [Kiloniella laminariae]